MGALFSHLVGKLLGDGRPHERTHENEIDHNVLVCCGNLTVREKQAEEERIDGDEDHIRG